MTPTGSGHDLRFSRTWALLAADADLLAEHNAVKASADPGGAEYEARKSAFFDRVVALWPTHPAGARASTSTGGP